MTPCLYEDLRDAVDPMKEPFPPEESEKGAENLESPSRTLASGYIRNTLGTGTPETEFKEPFSIRTSTLTFGMACIWGGRDWPSRGGKDARYLELDPVI